MLGSLAAKSRVERENDDSGEMSDSDSDFGEAEVNESIPAPPPAAPPAPPAGDPSTVPPSPSPMLSTTPPPSTPVSDPAPPPAHDPKEPLPPSVAATRPALRGVYNAEERIWAGEWGMTELAFNPGGLLSTFHYRFNKAAEPEDLEDGRPKTLPEGVVDMYVTGFFYIDTTPVGSQVRLQPTKIPEKSVLMRFYRREEYTKTAMNVTFADDETLYVRGEGKNRYGSFTLEGTYDATTGQLDAYRAYLPAVRKARTPVGGSATGPLRELGELQASASSFQLSERKARSRFPAYRTIIEEGPESSSNRASTKHLRGLVNKVIEWDKGRIFINPVDPSVVLDYDKYVSKPMCLSVVRQKLQNGIYPSETEVVADVELVFTNAMLYNPKEHFVHSLAQDHLTRFRAELDKLRAKREHDRQTGKLPKKSSSSARSSNVLLGPDGRPLPLSAYIGPDSDDDRPGRADDDEDFTFDKSHSGHGRSSSSQRSRSRPRGSSKPRKKQKTASNANYVNPIHPERIASTAYAAKGGTIPGVPGYDARADSAEVLTLRARVTELEKQLDAMRVLHEAHLKSLMSATSTGGAAAPPPAAFTGRPASASRSSGFVANQSIDAVMPPSTLPVVASPKRVPSTGPKEIPVPFALPSSDSSLAPAAAPTTASAPPVKTEVGLTYDEKEKLTEDIGALGERNPDALEQILGIIQASAAAGALESGDEDEEMELDVDKLDTQTLRKLQAFVSAA